MEVDLRVVLDKSGYLGLSEYKSPSEIKKLKFIVKCVEEFKGQRKSEDLNILEIGCGRGNICFPLAGLGYRTVGIDLNPEAIQYALQKNKFSNLEFRVADAQTIESDSRFDIIICSEVLEHLAIPQELTKRFPGLIASGGLLILTIPNGYGPYSMLFDLPQRIIHRIFGTTDPYGHKQNFSLSAFVRLVKPFSITQMRHSDFLSFIPGISRSKAVVEIDCAIADALPYYLVSGWYFALKMESEGGI